ncbi:aminotransferase [Deltaproteobacteria bacterium Smac51]|nr:aminotransferase [Deltaproteobacteria bacterium Smac51]
MKYDFDKIIPRKNTNCIKYDFAKVFGKPEDAIPMWVADMDFQVPPEVTECIKAFADFAIYGYSDSGPAYFAAVHNWFKEHFGFVTEREWMVKTPGIVYALANAVRSLTEEGDSIIIQQPVYHPFPKVIQSNNRNLVVSELKLENGRYRVDLDDFKRKIIDNKAKMFILCSPHNPVGRVWTQEELKAMGDICLNHNCLVISDEIHCDFAHQGHQHHVFATVSPDFAENCVICTAPSKTFNLAGLQASNVFIANKKVREKFKGELERSGYEELNCMGLVACQAAYEYGGEWLKQLKEYLAGNLDYMRNFLKTELPRVKLIEPEGTYLAWLDFRELGHDPNDLNKFLAEKAKIWFDDGLKFGPAGAGFQRINLGCPRSIVEKAMGQLASALK